MKLLLFLLLASTVSLAQGIGGKAGVGGKAGFGGGATVGGTWTFVNFSAGNAGGAESLTCVTTTCTLTVPSTGTGHALMLGAMNAAGSGITISSVSGGCSSWVVDASAHKSSASITDMNGAYCLSSTSGATSVVVTFSTTAGTAVVMMYEASWSGSSITHDTTASTQNAASATPSGQALTLTGTDAVMQFVTSAGGTVTTVNAPYTTLFKNSDPAGGGAFSFTGGSAALNPTGSAPTWTLSASQPTLVFGMALKGN